MGVFDKNIKISIVENNKNGIAMVNETISETSRKLLEVIIKEEYKYKNVHVLSFEGEIEKNSYTGNIIITYEKMGKGKMIEAMQEIEELQIKESVTMIGEVVKWASRR